MCIRPLGSAPLGAPSRRSSFGRRKEPIDPGASTGGPQGAARGEVCRGGVGRGGGTRDPRLNGRTALCISPRCTQIAAGVGCAPARWRDCERGRCVRAWGGLTHVSARVRGNRAHTPGSSAAGGNPVATEGCAGRGSAYNAASATARRSHPHRQRPPARPTSRCRPANGPNGRLARELAGRVCSRAAGTLRGGGAGRGSA